MARSRFLLRAAITLSSPVFSVVLAGINFQSLSKAATPYSPSTKAGLTRITGGMRFCTSKDEPKLVPPQKQKAAHNSVRGLWKSTLLLRLADCDLAGFHLLRFRKRKRQNPLIHP